MKKSILAALLIELSILDCHPQSRSSYLTEVNRDSLLPNYQEDTVTVYLGGRSGITPATTLQFALAVFLMGLLSEI
jgi:hypothetical protein